MLKKIVSITFILSIYAQAFDFNLKPTKLSDELYCFFGKLEVPSEENAGNMSNSCYVKGDNSYIVIDTGSNYEFGKQTYEAMSKIAKLPVEAVIVSHEHDDHFLGNAFFKDVFGAKIIGPSTFNDKYSSSSKTRMMSLLSEKIMHKTRVVPVDVKISEETKMIISGKEFTFIPLGFKAHSPQDLVIYLEKEKILFAADVIMNGRLNSTRDGSVIGMLKAVDLVKSKDWNILVPGHGFDTTETAPNETEQYYSLLKQRVMKAVEDEIGVGSVSSVVLMEEFKDMPFYDVFNKRNVFDAYSELEFYDGE